MNHLQTAQIIKQLCQRKSIPVSQLLSECHIRKSFIYDLEKRQFTPSTETIEQIANYFDVSIDYLVGRTDNPKINK